MALLKSSSILGLLLAASLLNIQSISTADNPDEIKSLTGLKFKINFRQYSGYLHAEHDVYLHYWMFESQRTPSSDPVVFWFNGGPGASSLMGAFTENGPFRVMSDETLAMNDYAWNAQANMVYIESPAGVGFSYKLDGNYTWNDDTTAMNNHAAIKSFFSKYPQYKNNDFYITGESYGGIYVPTLSVLVLGDDNLKTKFKGFAIGNGYMDDELNTNSQLHFLYHHGLVGDQVWKMVREICCPHVQCAMQCNFAQSQDPACEQKINELVTKMRKRFNRYNIYAPKFPEAMANPSAVRMKTESHFDPSTSLSGYTSVNSNDRKSPPDTDWDALRKWLNKPEVRKELHISPKALPWNDYGNITYTNNYNSMKIQIKKLIHSGLKGLIYNGDFDAVCNYLGDRWFVEDLGFTTVNGYQPWTYNDRVAGFQINFGKLIYKTVMAAGHMVPTDQPGKALALFNDFLES